MGKRGRPATSGQSRAASPERAEIGRRMKAAAVQAGLSGAAIARRIGVAVPTVYRWWYGELAPSSDKMVAYARLVDTPVEALYGGKGEAEEQPREVADFLLRWAGRFLAGEDPGAAFDRVTGEPAELTPRQRQQLATAAPRMRAELTAAAGGDWERLTEAEQRQLLEQIARLAERRRKAPEEPP